LIAVIAGAAEPGFGIAIQALMDFCYLGQMKVIDKRILDRMQFALKEFHNNKHEIQKAGVRIGSKKKPINNFQIPKLAMMQSAVLSIRLVGSLIQWSADITEHCNITVIKKPARASNNKSYDAQICRFLNHHENERSRIFDLALHL
jgi:hypothetical protein